MDYIDEMLGNAMVMILDAIQLAMFSPWNA